MSTTGTYLLGVATLPAFALGGWLIVFAVARCADLMGRITLGTLHHIGKTTNHRILGSAAYAAKRGVTFAAGELGVIVVVGQDNERFKKAASALGRIDAPSPRTFKKGTGGDS